MPAQLIPRHNLAGLFPVTIEDEPQVLGNVGDIMAHDIRDLKRWIQKNKTHLLRLWSDEVSPLKFIRSAMVPLANPVAIDGQHNEAIEPELEAAASTES